MLPALRDLMDAAPDEKVVNAVRTAAQRVPRVLAVEKVHVRRSGMVYHVDIHVQAAPTLPLIESHSLGGQVKAAIREAVPKVSGVLVHMEPFEGDSPGVPGGVSSLKNRIAYAPPEIAVRKQPEQ